MLIAVYFITVSVLYCNWHLGSLFSKCNALWEKLTISSAIFLVGKSMLLSAIGHREVPIPEHIDIYHLTREMRPSEKTALQCVMEVDEERVKLEREAERLAHEDCKCTHTHTPKRRKEGNAGYSPTFS